MNLISPGHIPTYGITIIIHFKLDIATVKYFLLFTGYLPNEIARKSTVYHPQTALPPPPQGWNQLNSAN